MIQLLLAPYTDKEVQELEGTLRKALDDLRIKCRTHQYPCDKCPTRHLCADLEKAIKFAEEVRK